MQQHLEWLKSRMTITTKMEKKLLKMEMEQITDAYISSMKNERNLLNIKSAENYYNETYNQEK